MKLKLDENGHVVLNDKGLPIYIHEDGKELPFDAAASVAKIAALNNEAMGHRRQKEEALEKLKVFEGLDPAQARKAIETVANLDAKKLIDAGEVERVKAEAKATFDEQLKAVEEKYKPIVKERDQLKIDFDNERLTNAFANSAYVRDKLAVPADIVQAKFGASFKFKDGKLAAFQGEKQIFSRVNPGDPAEFEEALEIIVDAYPSRDSLVKGAGGGGGKGGGGGAGGKSLRREQFDALDPAAKQAHMKGGGTVTD